jgi:hypothetical protein
MPENVPLLLKPNGVPVFQNVVLDQTVKRNSNKQNIDEFE